jgi:hypothetical protein
LSSNLSTFSDPSELSEEFLRAAFSLVDADTILTDDKLDGLNNRKQKMVSALQHLPADNSMKETARSLSAASAEAPSIFGPKEMEDYVKGLKRELDIRGKPKEGGAEELQPMSEVEQWKKGAQQLQEELKIANEQAAVQYAAYMELKEMILAKQYNPRLRGLPIRNDNPSDKLPSEAE